MSTLLWIISFIALSFILHWLYYTIKATKDPDVIAATKLDMLITHYNKYKKIQAQLEELYNRGITEGDEIKELMKQIPNMNEWYRFCDYQYKLSCDKWKKELEKIGKL